MEAYRLMVCGRSLVIRSWKYCLRRSTSSAKQSMVLEPEQDRTVQPKKPQTGHFYGLFNMKNRSMKKKNSEPYRPRLDRLVLWTVTGSNDSHGPFVSSLKLHRFGLSSLFFFPIRRHLDFGIGSLSQTRNPRLTLSIKKPSINTSRNSRFGRHGVWTVKLNSQPKKKKKMK